MTPEEKLASMGLELPRTPTPVANYVPFKRDGNTLYLSGQGPRRPDGSMDHIEADPNGTGTFSPLNP